MYTIYNVYYTISHLPYVPWHIYHILVPQGDKLSMLTQTYKHRSLRKIMMSHLVICKHRIDYGHTWRQMSLPRPGVIKQHNYSMYSKTVNLCSWNLWWVFSWVTCTVHGTHLMHQNKYEGNLSWTTSENDRKMWLCSRFKCTLDTGKL